MVEEYMTTADSFVSASRHAVLTAEHIIDRTPPRRRISMMLTGLGVVASTLVGTTTSVAAYPAADSNDHVVRASAQRSVYVITDSVVLGAENEITSTFSSHGWDVTIEGLPGLNTKTAADVVTSRRDAIGDNVIVALGHNETPNRVSMASTFDSMMHTLDGVPNVVWVKLRDVRPEDVSARGWQQIAGYRSTFAMVNEELERLADRWPRLVLADWTTTAHRGGISYDAIHLNPLGAQLMADLLWREMNGFNRPEPNEIVRVPLANSPSRPASGGSAVLNVTVTDPNRGGFVTAWPCDRPRPTTSNVNFTSGRTVANLVIVEPGDSDEICLAASVRAHLVADLQGWLPAGAGFEPEPAVRLWDTRTAATHERLSPSSVFALDVGDSSRTLALNVTVTEPTGDGFLTAWPCDEPRPGTSNLDHLADQTVANLVFVRSSADGRICLAVHAATHVVVDRFGSFASGSTSTDTERLFDSRLASLPVGPSSITEIYVPGPLNAANTTAGPGSVAVDVTAVGARDPGFLTVYPCGQPLPASSNLNVMPGVAVVGNLAISPVGPDGRICVFSQVATDLVVDLVASIGGPAVGTADAALEPMAALRVLDTRSRVA